MAFVNQETREIQLKVVYYGPARCGKTTNLEVVHRLIKPDHKGSLTSLDTVKDRTLFFDFMPLVADVIHGFTTRFQMYTVPGQVMYNTTRAIVLRGVDGVVFVADSQYEKMTENVESFQNLQDNLRALKLDLDDIPYVLQYNKRDLPNAVDFDYLKEHINPTHVPDFEAVATTGVGVFDTLKAVAKQVLIELKRGR